MFIDQAEIVAIGGAGGNGCQAMFKAPYSRYPRPSGGNGGDGGDVVLVADPQLTTLLDFQFKHEFRGERGRHGSGNNKTGRSGGVCLVKVPLGTVVYAAETGHQLRDLATPGQRLTVAEGGRGGVGNNNAPQAKPGTAGTQRRLRFELKLIADVGLVGFPNAGKSSLLARISTARPKIAHYPFTTRAPVLGVVSVGPDASFVACDIPGLIEGAHLGKGLGFQFLRHVERTRVLIHVVDLAGVDGRDPVDAVHRIDDELLRYHAELARRPQLIAANKMDLPEARERLAAFRAKMDAPVFPISCATGEGIPALLQAAWQRVQSVRPSASTPVTPTP